METLKNSVRATLDHNQGLDILPPVCMVTNELMRTSDFTGQRDHSPRLQQHMYQLVRSGGGVPMEFYDDIWRYGVTSLKLEGVTGNDGLDSRRFREMQRLVGYGFGLPLSRLYAEYFGGSLKFISQPG
eukprot:GHVN01084191.1.p1 GENE.GHVN01084191.1~~GHVN01084191.1.p1  ORF type:complete len:147 (+),score=1.64 GHVN01084191.1:58-441(+)